MATTRKKTSTSGPKKTGTKKTGATKSTPRYGPAASEAVETEMHELNAGTLRSGGSGKKVKSRKQAIAIGLSKARRAGAKVPAQPARKKK